MAKPGQAKVLQESKRDHSFCSLLHRKCWFLSHRLRRSHRQKRNFCLDLPGSRISRSLDTPESLEGGFWITYDEDSEATEVHGEESRPQPQAPVRG